MCIYTYTADKKTEEMELIRHERWELVWYVCQEVVRSARVNQGPNLGAPVVQYDLAAYAPKILFASHALTKSEISPAISCRI